MPSKRSPNRLAVSGAPTHKGSRVRTVTQPLTKVIRKERSPHKARRLYGTRQGGKSYERKVERALKAQQKVIGFNRMDAGPWFYYEDGAGVGHAQPDFVLAYPWGILILECKLTETATAWIQLRRLYTPLLQYMFPMLHVRCIQVCNRLSPDERICARRTLISSLADPLDGGTLHFLGHESLV